MADKTIWEYPTLMTAQPDDLILMASDEETYNMKVQTLKDAMGEAASKPPIVRNGNWWTWSAAAEDYVDSGTAATGPQGVKGDTGDTGPQGPQGVKGDTGSAAGFGTVTASVDSNVGTPSVDITTSGPDTAKNFFFAFHNLKGPTGDVTPAAQQAASDAQAAAAAAAGSATNAAGSATAAAGSASVAYGSANAASRSAQNAENAAASIATDISALQSGLAIIVDGDAASMAVPVGGYAYIKNNTHGLAEGLYTNSSSAAFPASGGTANSSVFTAKSEGGLNAIKQSLEAKSKTETITFDANGYGYTSLLRSNTILFLARDTTDWYIFNVFGNNQVNYWAVRTVNGALKNVSHTVALYYFDV